MSLELNIFYDAALELIKEAGKLILSRIYNKNKSVEIKTNDIDFVTETDQQVEKILIESLKKQFPSHEFIGEESVASGTSCNLTENPTWIIDPVDGTLNFVHGYPHSCISLALFINKQPVIGIIYNPMLDQLFSAKKSQGAFLNNKSIKVSGQTEVSQSLIMMELNTSRDDKKFEMLMDNSKTLLKEVHGLRSLGSAALDMAMVALGGADAYFEYGIHIWDIAAGELIITEAGGVVIDPSGGPIDRMSRRVLAASSQELAKKLSAKLTQFYPTPRD